MTLAEFANGGAGFATLTILVTLTWIAWTKQPRDPKKSDHED